METMRHNETNKLTSLNEGCVVRRFWLSKYRKAKGWILEPASIADWNNAALNGRMPLPLEVRASGKKQTFFPSASDRQIASLMILMSFRLLRSINTVSALRATRPITGQRLNSFMAIKLLGQSAVIAKISSNDMWLATTNTPFKLSDGLFIAIRRTFNMESASAQIEENSAFRCSTEALSNRLIRRTVENSQRSILNSREKRVKNGVE